MDIPEGESFGMHDFRINSNIENDIGNGFMDIKFYEENGYLIVSDFIGEEECNYLQEEADKLVNGVHSNILNIHLKG